MGKDSVTKKLRRLKKKKAKPVTTDTCHRRTKTLSDGPLRFSPFVYFRAVNYWLLFRRKDGCFADLGKRYYEGISETTG
jgi:hypothetical protein